MFFTVDIDEGKACVAAKVFQSGCFQYIDRISIAFQWLFSIKKFIFLKKLFLEKEVQHALYLVPSYCRCYMQAKMSGHHFRFNLDLCNLNVSPSNILAAG